MDISVCMIVKNEEKVVERILHQVIKFADEIIIVDTGSQDNTKELCNKYTDKIYDFKWCDDFSKARNYSFSKATKEYIMWLDADDYITDKEVSKIINLKNSYENIDTYMFKYNIAFDENNNPTFSYYRERLLKRDNCNRWQGFIHEVITPKGKIKYVDITIEHRKISGGNPKRNLNIYRKHLREGAVLNAREEYYYFRELYYNKHYKKALIEFKKYLKLKDKYTPNIIDAYIISSNIYCILGDYKKALSESFSCIQQYLPTPEVCCTIANIFEHLDNIYQCIYWYEVALVTPRQVHGFINIDTEKFIPYVELSRLYYNLNDYCTAKKYFLLSKECKPNHPSVTHNSNFFKK